MSQGPTSGDKAASFRREAALPFQRMDEETIVVDPRAREVHLLNETAARIWDLLESASSVDEIVEALADEYEGAPPEELRREVEAFLGELGGKGLLASKASA
jgi:PqqD family protein of HPr-rel-A system